MPLPIEPESGKVYRPQNAPLRNTRSAKQSGSEGKAEAGEIVDTAPEMQQSVIASNTEAAVRDRAAVRQLAQGLSQRIPKEAALARTTQANVSSTTVKSLLES